MRAKFWTLAPVIYLLHGTLAVPVAESYGNSSEFHQLQRRADTKACASAGLPFEYFIRRSPIGGYETQTGPDDCTAAGRVKHNGVTGGWDLKVLTKARTPFQVYKGDNWRSMTDLDEGAVGLGTHTCDHILEIGIVKVILETPGGACKVAAQMIADAPDDKKEEVTADVKAKLYNIVGILNGPKNLVFLGKTVESLKGDAVTAAKDGAKSPLGNTGKGKKRKGPGFWLPGGVYDYLEFKTKSWSVGVANDIDHAIERDFPGAVAGVEPFWSGILQKIKVEGQKVMRDAQQEINAATCTAPTGSGSGTGKRDILVPLYTTSLGSGSGFDVYSSLTARAAAILAGGKGSRVKSGPKAPPGQCCPSKKQPPKKAIPRSQVKTKTKPATRPRAATQHPAPKPRNPKKQVAPRPASRAKRQAGKAVQPKRTTPKRVPKKVPKPTRRPKGKVRPRKRR